MERRITLAGTLNNCRCGRQPQLFHNEVKSLYYMECPVCVVRLWQFSSAGEAVQHWEELPVLEELHPPVDATPTAVNYNAVVR